MRIQSKGGAHAASFLPPVRTRTTSTRVPQGLQHLATLSRLATEPGRRAEILPLAAELAVPEVGGDACVAVLVDGNQGRMRAASGCELDPSWRCEADELGPELSDLVLRAFAERGCHYHQAVVAALISDGALFGALVILFQSSTRAGPKPSAALQPLCDITASALAAAAQFERLEQVNAELRATRAALERNEKLRALGEMAAGVAHDLKNILNPLGLFLQLAGRQVKTGKLDDAQGSLREMKMVVDRGVGLLESLRQFSRQEPDSAAHLVDLSVLVREAVMIARPRAIGQCRALPRFVEELTDGCNVLGRNGEIVAAVVNLIANAQDAMDGGNITVRTGRLGNGSYVDVEDDGPGMTAEVRDKVFEPFFSTKGEQGTGLGLAMVYSTMLRHRGTVEVFSEPGKGARFRLWFPSPSQIE